MPIKKVTMGLTDWDIANTESLMKRLHSRNKAAAVSSALAITEGITKRLEDGGELVIRKKDGTVESIMITGM